MKKASFLFITTLFTSFMARADYFVTKSAGGPTGYSHVEQSSYNGTTHLSCVGVGYLDCSSPADFPPSSVPKIAVDNAISEVDQRISNGQSSGQLYLNGYNVNWQGADVFNYSLSIK